ncbi:fat storage-inducing transmembrane protein 1-like isoform X2 [Hypomesus transpacificus]|uniref:fat storage-inducing transmembrane protein 1-like isoform X2 n=1 Tax=Hypomesus transpacificus TaxID=137520 RepID=UPI001F082184|nr:fat storage-inducing transmembrane protein 1-like isoform X2 [Hypomesus transpacificus]
MFLNTILVVVTDLAAGLLGNVSVRRHFHLLLTGCLVMFGPALSLWVSQYSVFAKRTHFLYRGFLRSGWGWTCVFVGSFVFLQNATGSCYEPLASSPEGQGGGANGQPLPLLPYLGRGNGCVWALSDSGWGIWGAIASALSVLRAAVVTLDLLVALPASVLPPVPHTVAGGCAGLPDLARALPGLVPDGA